MYYIDKRVEVNDAIVTPDGKCEATIASIINYFQNCALFHSEDVGVGFEYLTEKGIGWVLNSWQVDVDRFPSYAEKLKVYTNPYEIKGFMGKRNFCIVDENDKMIVKANSNWTLLSLQTGRPVKAGDAIINAYDYEEKLDMEYAPRKIDIPENGVEGKSVEIVSHHLDMNLHVNNGQYIAIAMDCLPVDFRPYHLRAEYKSQVRLGETLTPLISKVDDDTYIIALKKNSDEIVTIVEFRT